MADERKQYTVDVLGLPHTMLLDEQTAAQYGERAKLVEKTSTKAKTPANKARTTDVDTKD